MNRILRTALRVVGITAYVGAMLAGMFIGGGMAMDRNPWGIVIAAVTFAFWMTPVVWWSTERS